MPGSSIKGKEQIAKWYKAVGNKRYILDVGPGWGTYSKMLRSGNERWHAVEIHKKYIERFNLNKYYDKIYIADIRSFKPKEMYDIIICGDVIEHITNEQAKNVLRKLLDHTSYLIISLPLDAETHAPRGTGDIDWGNPHELHSGLWSNKMFISTIIDINGDIIALEKYSELAIYLIKNSQSKLPINMFSEKLYNQILKRKIYNSIEEKPSIFRGCWSPCGCCCRMQKKVFR